MNIINLMQIFIYKFKELLLDEDLMIMMKVNKQTRELMIGNDKILNILKDKKFKIKNVGYSLDIIKWIVDDNYKINNKLMYIVSKIKILKWLIHKGLKLNSDVCSYAALNGNIEILKWARKQGCEWDSFVCEYAAKMDI